MQDITRLGENSSFIYSSVSLLSYNFAWESLFIVTLQETELQYSKVSYEFNYNTLYLQWKKADKVNMMKKK